MKNNKKAFYLLTLAIIILLAISESIYLYGNKKDRNIQEVQLVNVQNLTIDQLSNLSYGYPSTPIVFTNGQYIYNNVGTNGQPQPGDDYLVGIDAKLITFGDLNSDGFKDAVVPIYKKHLDNNVPDQLPKTESSFYVVLNKNGKPFPIPNTTDVAYDSQSCGIYGGLIIQSIKIEAGKIVVNVLSKQICNAEESVAKVITYKIENNQIVLLSVKEGAFNNTEKSVYKNTKLGIQFEYPSTWQGIEESLGYGCEDYYNYPPQFQRSLSTICESISLKASSTQSFFLNSQSKLYIKNGPPRGGSFADLGLVDEKYVSDYCKNNKTTSCMVYKNLNNINVAKAVIDYPCVENQEEGCFGHKVLYIIKSPNLEFPGILFYTESDEKNLDGVVNSLKFISS